MFAGGSRLPLFRVYKIKKSTKSYYLSSFEKNAQLLAETLTNICKLSEITVIGFIFRNIPREQLHIVSPK